MVDWFWFGLLLYALFNCHGYIEGGDGDGMIHINSASAHLPKQGLLYTPHHIDMV